MNRIKKKLNSERGASITWALLIFLVCTVVGSAVLVAGTAAAGRMSKLAESDQRYYAVTSAAGLLSDVLGQEICRGCIQNIKFESAERQSDEVCYWICDGMGVHDEC